jgi:hypothetical protein
MHKYFLWMLSEKFVVEEDVDEIFETLDEAHKQFKQIKDEKKKLLKANKMLVDLLLKMENVLDDSELEAISLDSHDYSFDDGWTGHEDKVRLEDSSKDSIETQLEELERLIKKAETF